MNNLKNLKDIEILKKGGRILAEILNTIAIEAREGVTTLELNNLAEDLILKAGATPAFKGYRPSGFDEPYPFSLCTSLNSVIVHGLPQKDRVLKKGDILGLDLGIEYEGLFTDMALTVAIEPVSEEARKLVSVTAAALNVGIREVKAGGRIGDIGLQIERFVQSFGFSVIRDLVGHGVGFAVHEEPTVPNWGKRGEGEELMPGMVLAIEPMVSLGSGEIKISQDGWGYETQDNNLAAHFEKTILVTKEGAEILTKI